MENVFEILVGISVIWSIISSLKKKKPADTTNSSQISTTNTPEKIDFNSLFSEIKTEISHQFGPQFEETIPVENVQVAPVVIKKEAQMTLAHKFPKHVKRGFAANSPINRFSKPSWKSTKTSEFEEVLDHEHFDTNLKEHYLLEIKPKVQKNEDLDIEIDVNRMFDTQEIREAVLLSEILDKPISLRRNR